MNRAEIALLFLLTAPASGCLSLRPATAEPIRFFVLTSSIDAPAAEAELEREPCRLRIDQVHLPEYLETRKIAVRIGENEVEFREFDRWAEAVNEGLLRVLKENLEALPEVDTVELAPFRRGDDWDYTLSVSVRRFEGDRSRGDGPRARFEVFWTLRSEELSPAQKSGHYRSLEPWDGETYRALAKSFSQAAFDLSRTLVDGLGGASKSQRQQNPEEEGP